METKRIFTVIRAALAVLCIIFSVFSAAAENADGGQAEDKPPEVSSKISPVFPEENPNIVFIEGEDAVSTNFNREPTMNYDCSGSRALQLSRTTGLQGGEAFYADYVFYAEESGTYEFWYGGTPPGPGNDSYPSYSSPFQYTLDDSAVPVKIFREETVVVANYAPSYYWNMVKDVNLEKGRHKLRIQVTAKRAYDQRFYFYLDCLFFARKENGKRIIGDKLPARFPENMNDRSINYPFKSIDDYLIIIRDNPQDTAPLVELSMIYTLLSDYLNAVKYLKKALSLNPENLEVKLLIAKNCIWNGDLTTGLNQYREILKKKPKQYAVWMEAGKMAGWTQRYKDSIAFFKQGLSEFPDDVSILINMALTYAWSSNMAEAEKTIQKANKLAGSDPGKMKKLAGEFTVSGYPDWAIPVYLHGLSAAPRDLEMALRLEETYNRINEKNKADQIRRYIEKRYLPSARLTRYLEMYRERASLKEQVIREYLEKLEREPDNLALREVLAQTYFWNGQKEAAINEYLNILTNRAYNSLQKMMQANGKLIENMDKLYTYLNVFDRISGLLSKKREDLIRQTENYTRASKMYSDYLKEASIAAEEGEEISKPDQDPEIIRNTEAALLANLMEEVKKTLTDYKAATDKLSEGMSTITAILVAAREEQEIFSRVAAGLGWNWDRKVMMEELTNVSRSLPLAGHVIAMISQIEKKITDAKNLYKNLSTGEIYPGLACSYYETMIWNGDLVQATNFFQDNSAGITKIAPYTDSLNRVMLALISIGTQPQTGNLGDDPEADVTAMVESINEFLKDAANRKKDCREQLKLLHDALYNKMVKSFFEYAEETYLLRNELGDFYLARKELDSAIIQFRQVLSIDPNNLSAIYRLGTVYQWNRDWFQARENFLKVYGADPFFENAASLYNQVEREHADKLSLETYSTVDTSRVITHAGFTYQAPLNSLFGLKGGYDMENTYYYTWGNNYSYLTHTLGLGLEMDLNFLNLKLTPYGGGTFYLNDAFYADVATKSPIPLIDYIKYNAVSPFIRLDFSLALFSSLSIYGNGGFRMYPDTLSYNISDVYDIFGELNITYRFSFIDHYPLSDTSLRAYGTIDVLLDGNTVIKPGAELNLPFLSFDNPFSLFTITVIGGYQDALSDMSTGYWSPNQVFQIYGLLGFSMQFAPQEAKEAFGFALKGGGGIYIDQMGLPGATNYNKFEGEGSLTYKSLSSNYYLSVNFNGTTEIYNPLYFAYWAATIKLGGSIKLPDLLAP